ncbi:hypothetical protein F511_17613 [Dorcoceras hygrometricum]|uniref:Uncharacterized protein n=1 Tax=Dorcoceras hygrometricum TaxID=472368 RepID=A0A2Z7B7Q4_9LAMI|nr:hypothetical protein F511_17613 [Dorcoceras hygrometricum]
MRAFVRAACGERRARARMSRTMACDAAPTGRRPCATPPPHLHELVDQVAAPCAHVAHGGAHGVRRSGCTCAGGDAPPLRRLRGGEATTVFDF